jgi:hypothetical protein
MGIRITNLPSATVVNNADVLPIVQDGVTKQAQYGIVRTTNAGDLTTGTVAVARLPIGTTVSAGALRLGNVEGTACEGNDARLSDSRTPTGAAGGDLAGTYPNPTLATLSPSPAGTYGSTASLPVLAVNAKGQVTEVNSITLARSATVDATNAANITTGLLPSVCMPPLVGDVTTSPGSTNTSLVASGVAAGVYGSSSSVAQFTVDSKGRITGAANVGISGSAGGTVTSVGITSSTLSVAHSPVTFEGNIGVDLPNSGVTPGTVGSSTQIPVLTVDAQGRVTAFATAFVSSLTTQEVAALTTSQLSAISVSAGAGLVGGGNIAASSTLSLAPLIPNPVGTYGSSAQIPVLTLNEFGQVTSVSTEATNALTTAQLSITPNPIGTYGSSAQIPVLTLNQFGQVTSVQTEPISSITTTQIAALTTSQLSAISVNAGTGLTGGGPLSASSTLSLAALAPSPAGTYGTTSSIPILTVDGFGRITSATTGAIGLPNAVGYLMETATISATAATGTIPFDVITQPTLYYTVNATAAFTLNIRGNSTTTLNSLMPIGRALTVTFLYQTGTTAFSLSGIQIDGVATTIRWSNGTAPTAVASNINSYTFSIIKTAASTYTVIGSFLRFN